MRPRPEALGSRTSPSPISIAIGWFGSFVSVEPREQCVTPGTAGGSRDAVSSIRIRPSLRSRTPGLRGARMRPMGVVSGNAFRARSVRSTALDRVAPRCGVPSVMMSRRCLTHSWSASWPWCAALRATSPPMEWPIRVMLCKGTGQSEVTCSSNRGELGAVRADGVATAVPDCERRDLEVRLHLLGVRDAPLGGAARLAAPVGLGLCQAVHEHDDVRTSVSEAQRQCDREVAHRRGRG